MIPIDSGKFDMHMVQVSKDNPIRLVESIRFGSAIGMFSDGSTDVLIDDSTLALQLEYSTNTDPEVHTDMYLLHVVDGLRAIEGICSHIFKSEERMLDALNYLGKMAMEDRSEHEGEK